MQEIAATWQSIHFLAPEHWRIRPAVSQRRLVSRFSSPEEIRDVLPKRKVPGARSAPATSPDRYPESHPLVELRGGEERKLVSGSGLINGMGSRGHARKTAYHSEKGPILRHGMSQKGAKNGMRIGENEWDAVYETTC